MKINRFIALAVIALLAVGVMGMFSAKVFALNSENTSSVTSDACAHDQGDVTEVSPSAPETDKVDAQCGDQHGPDAQGTAEAPRTEQAGEHHHDENGTVEAPDTENGNEQAGDQNGADRKDAVEAPGTEQDNEQAGHQDGPDNGTEVPEIQATATP